MTKIDLHSVDKIIRDVATTEIMPRFLNLAEGDVEMKGVNDPVSIADKEAERHLTERFASYLPGSIVVGEESFAKDKSVMGRLDMEHPVWIIDPIDGTRNFVAGKAEFAVMVALVIGRKPIAAWIHDPNSGDTIMAEQGGGVWLRGKRMTLAFSDINADSIGLVGSRVKKLVSDPTVMPQSPDMPKIEIGSCAGFDYPRLFKGDVTFADANTSRAGFSIYRHTNAWDHVPGLFLHQEGGGYSADWDGLPYHMNKNRSGLLFAPNREAWAYLHKMFEPLMQHTSLAAPQ
jgi:fructose-1,6-bisphosphatase/inositol monophosphatase family enzyme